MFLVFVSWCEDGYLVVRCVDGKSCRVGVSDESKSGKIVWKKIEGMEEVYMK
jgi:hypothetical protein